MKTARVYRVWTWGFFPSRLADDSRWTRARETRTLDVESPALSLPGVNRSLRDRLTAFLAAALFLLSGAGDAFGAHPCPHHAAIAAPAAFAAPAASAADASVAHAPADAHHGHAADHSAPAGPAEHDEHDACTCADVCPSGAGAAPLPRSRFSDLPVPVTSPAPVARTDDATLPSRLLPHVLPFAQAPPSQV